MEIFERTNYFTRAIILPRKTDFISAIVFYIFFATKSRKQAEELVNHFSEISGKYQEKYQGMSGNVKFLKKNVHLCNLLEFSEIFRKATF